MRGGEKREMKTWELEAEKDGGEERGTFILQLEDLRGGIKKTSFFYFLSKS